MIALTGVTSRSVSLVNVFFINTTTPMVSK